MAHLLEEKLREAACLGDLYATRTLISRNVNINSQNVVNGWTALHWAVKRGHEDVVRLLLQHGANPNVTNNKGEKPSSLSSNPNISNLFGETIESVTTKVKELDFVPSYIENPPLFVDLLDVEPDILTRRPQLQTTVANKSTVKNDLIVRTRIKNSEDDDYIEFDMSTENITYKALLKKCCEELEIREEQVVKIKRDLVRIRNDADVRRFRDSVYLDVFIKEN